jgi:hypothetical protein
MGDRSKFEQMLEYLINDEEAKAKELFHDIVVAKSREIYENLLAEDFEEEEESQEEARDGDDEDVEEMMGMMPHPEEEAFGGDAADDMLGDVGADDDMGGDDMDGMDDMGGDEMDMDMAGGDDELGDRLDDLEAELASIRDEFEAQLGGDEKGSDDMGGDEEGGEMPPMGDEEGSEEDDVKDAMYFEKRDEDDEEDDDKEEKTDEDFIREYVEKVGGGNYNTWGKMGDDGVNTKSPVAGPNRMGGTAENILGNRNGEDAGEVGAGRKIKGNGVFNQNPQDLTSGLGEIHNRPGKTDAGKKAFKKKEPGHGAEKKGEAEGKAWGAGTGGAAGQVGNLNTKSPLSGAPGRAK